MTTVVDERVWVGQSGALCILELTTSSLSFLCISTVHMSTIPSTIIARTSVIF